MRFEIISELNGTFERDIIYLKYYHYDDYGYCTSYRAYVKSMENDSLVELGVVKIGCISLANKVAAGTSQNGFNSYSIKSLLPIKFDVLGDNFFSLGQSVDYYQAINKYFGDNSSDLYSGIKDLAFDFERFKALYDKREPSLYNSLMRKLHYANIEQFNRVTKGDAPLTKYAFSFDYNDNSLNFRVNPDSLPPSNIHVLIGRNGVGKTWLLYHMIFRILEAMGLDLDKPMSNKYKLSENFSLNDATSFAGVIGMSFSVFDDGLSSIKANNLSPSALEKLIMDNAFSKAYKYIGLICNQNYQNSDEKKQKTRNVTLKSVDMLSNEFVETLENISLDKYKKELYSEMCKYLETDLMLKNNGFKSQIESYFDDNENNKNTIIDFFKHLSSGHMIIILSLTALCDSIFEKTIVFIDEPETHLHPPLLSTYIRALSFILRKRNAVGIIATHSPIILQEVPQNCVIKVDREFEEMTFCRPKIETFASGTDQLTREIFGYELIKTGFYRLLKENLQDTFEDTFNKFSEHIGFLGQVMIQGLINNGDGNNEKN